MKPLRTVAALHRLIRRTTIILGTGTISMFLFLSSPAYAEGEIPAPAVTTIVTPAGDDSSYQIPWYHLGWLNGGVVVIFKWADVMMRL